MKLFSGKCHSKARLDGKTAVVTGCNTGIGKETVLDFVKRGARVIMACRNLEKADMAAEDIRKKTAGLEGVGQVVVTRLDLGSLASVKECAEYLLRTEPKINLLICNAGLFGLPKSTTVDGFEMHFGVNHLGHFLFTCLLLPRILRSGPARIVVVSSLLYTRGHINFDDLNWDKSYQATAAYGRSKLANILFAMELARRLHEMVLLYKTPSSMLVALLACYEGTEVTAYALHPGVVATEVFRNMDNGYFRGAKWLWDTAFALIYKTPEQGAQTTIYCAVEESLSKQNGLYYSDCAKEFLLPKARNAEAAKRLWTESAKMVGLGHWDPFTAPDSIENKEEINGI